jgi:hypothetical protein
MQVYLDRDGHSHKSVLSTQEARQGETTGRMRIVLAVSLVLALIAFGVLLAITL